MTPPTDWHPIFCAVEGPPATWRMIDPQGREYGRIELRRVAHGVEVRYRAEFRGQVIGWATSLRLAAERVHGAFLRSHGPGGSPMADWGESWRRTDA